MSSSWLIWIVLSWVTGSPVVAAVIVLAIWWLGDRATFRLLPDPFGFFRRRARAGDLRRSLATNPHDRRARLELGQLYLDTGRPALAAPLLRANIEAGDDDAHTIFAMGAALARTGEWDRAETVLAAARDRDPAFRQGEIDLELGRMRLRKGEAGGAVEPLRRFIGERPGTVEGRYWLGRALAATGDAAGARAARDDAWREYAALARFRRQRERPFAWRLKPWRPAFVAVLVLVLATLVLRNASVHPGPQGLPAGYRDAIDD